MNKKRILMGLGAFAFLGLTTVLTSCGGEKTYTVKFLDGQTELSSSTVTSGYNVEVPTAPTSDGKIFNGWYADEALTKPFDFGSIIEGDTNVYAAWVNEFTVTFKDGSKILSTTTVTSGYNVKAPANPTAKSGKTFAGWFADAALTKPFNFGSVITSATTVYAKWDSVYHNVNLYIDGNTLWKTVAIEEGETLSYEGAPTKDYREFANKWYTDAACTTLFNTATAVEEEFNLYAGWTAKMDVAESKFDFDAFQNYCGGSGKASTSEFTDGKFTIDAGMRVDTGPLLNTQGKNIVFDTIGSGTLSFKVSSKSSGNPLILSIYKLPLGTDVSATDFTKETAVYDKETPNGQTLEDSFTVEKGYRYVIKTVKSAGYTALSLAENVEVSAPEKIEVDSNKNQFIAGTELDLSLNVTEKFVNTSTKAVMPKAGDKKGYTVDTSKVDMTKAGTYKVTVNFTDTDDYGTYPMSAEFEVEVFDLKEIVLGFNATEKLSTNTKAGNGVYYNNKVAQVLGLGDKLDLSALTIKAVSTEEGFFELYKNKQTFEAENSSLTVSSIDTSTAGEKEVTVTLALNGVEKTATFKVNVVNTAPSVVNNVVKTYVDPAYTGVIGAVENGANTFNTIQQALDYLALQDKYDNVEKEIKLAEGTYNEKLEIEIPNLTIVGADSLADSSKYVISWNSLYGVADESGYAQLTDSTQTVAVRETAENCIIRGITIQNVYNTIDSYDDVYPGNGERGLALLLQADKFVMENGRLLGWQDTLETFTGRQVFNNCFIQGCVDYIFGTNSTTVFNGCEIHTVKSKASSKADAAAAYVTAYKGNNKGDNDYVQYGAIFNNCRFTVEDDFVGYVCIGRSWGAYAAVTVINSTFSDKFATTADTLIHEGLSVKNETSTLKYFFYNNKKEDSTDFVVEEDITGATHTLSQEQIAALHLDNVKETLDELFKLTNGKVTFNDYWNPIAKTTTIEVHDSEDNVIALYDINAYVGKTLTQSQINAIKDLISFNLNADTQVLDGIFTDMSYETAFDKNATLTDTDNNVVYAKIKKATPHDVTISYSQETGATNTGWEATISTANYTSVSMTPGLVTYKKDGNPAVAGAPAFTDGVNTYWMEPKTGSIKSPTITDTGIKEIYVSIYGGTSDTSDALEIDITAYDSSNTVVGKTTASTASGKKSGYASLTTGGSTTEEFIKVSAAEGKEISYFVVSLPGRKVGADTYDNTKQYGVTKINAKYTWYEFEQEDVKVTDNYSLDYSIISTGDLVAKENAVYYKVENSTANVLYANANNLTLIDSASYVTPEETVVSYDDAPITQAALKGANAFLGVGSGTVVYRDSVKYYKLSNSKVQASSNPGCIEIKDAGLTFTMKGTGTVKIKAASTGGSNYSTIGIKDSEGKYLPATYTASTSVETTTVNNLYRVKGTTYIEFTFNITDAGTYTIASDSSIDSRNTRIGGIEVADTYVVEAPKTAKDSYSITFGSAGNYSTSTNIDKTAANIQDNGNEDNNSQVNGDIKLNVKAGGVVVVYGYPGYYEYSVKVGSSDAVAATKEYTVVKVAEDSEVVVHSTKYLYEIDVIYPLTQDTEFNYSDHNLKTGSGLAFQFVAGKTVNDNSDSYQFKNDTYTAAVFTVAKAGTVVVTGHSKQYGLLDVYKNGEKQTLTISDFGTYTLEVAAGDFITVTGYTGDSADKNYIKGISYTVAPQTQNPTPSTPTLTLTNAINSSKLTASSLDNGTAIDTIFTVYGKNNGSVTVGSVTGLKVDGTASDISKSLNLTGGKMNKDSTYGWMNCVKIVLTETSTIKVVGTRKNDTSTTKLALYNESKETVKDGNLDAFGSKELTTISLENVAAGTYYLGAVSDGCILYSVEIFS